MPQDWLHGGGPTLVAPPRNARGIPRSIQGRRLAGFGLCSTGQTGRIRCQGLDLAQESIRTEPIDARRRFLGPENHTPTPIHCAGIGGHGVLVCCATASSPRGSMFSPVLRAVESGMPLSPVSSLEVPHGESKSRVDHGLPDCTRGSGQVPRILTQRSWGGSMPAPLPGLGTATALRARRCHAEDSE